MTTHDLFTVISLVTALVAVFFGPIVTYRIARRQVRASVVSANRHVWINNLRDAISDYLAKAMIARVLNARKHADDSSVPRIEEILRLNARIELLINPKEQDHARLMEQISEMTNTLNHQNPKNQTFDVDACQRRIVELAQSILKREWERVKQGD